MKHLFFKLLKPLSVLPAIIMLYLIFNFSVQNGEVSSNLSYKVSYKISTISDQIFSRELSEDELVYYTETIEGPVRKLAHMGEYFALALAISFPLYVYGRRGIQLILFSLILCVVFASLDEFHQYFVSGRTASPRDVLIDSIGSSLGIAVFYAIYRIALSHSRDENTQT